MDLSTYIIYTKLKCSLSLSNLNIFTQFNFMLLMVFLVIAFVELYFFRNQTIQKNHQLLLLTVISAVLLAHNQKQIVSLITITLFSLIRSRRRRYVVARHHLHVHHHHGLTLKGKSLALTKVRTMNRNTK